MTPDAAGNPLRWAAREQPTGFNHRECGPMRAVSLSALRFDVFESYRDRGARAPAVTGHPLFTVAEDPTATPNLRGEAGLRAPPYPSRDALSGSPRHPKETGAALGLLDHGTSGTVYLTNPDGNGIELAEDRHPSLWHFENGRLSVVNRPLKMGGPIKGRPAPDRRHRSSAISDRGSGTWTTANVFG
jgi:hypothetical protein